MSRLTSFPGSIRKRLLLLPLLALSMSMSQVSCSDTVGSLFVSDQDEMELGAEFHRQALDSFPIVAVFRPGQAPSWLRGATTEEQAFALYLDSVFRSILDRVPEDHRPLYHDQFTLSLLRDNTVNAFAVPGGYIYIYTGILRSFENESELAGVLGHEIAHVTRHHYRSSLAKHVGISLVIEAVAGGEGALTQLVTDVFGTLAALRMSRDHERDADWFGTRYLGLSGRHPRGIATFFARMENHMPAWLSTHPNPGDRVRNVGEQIQRDASLRALDADTSIKFTTRWLQMRELLTSP